jgi:polyphosphate kinase 2 (PPK2 family)
MLAWPRKRRTPKKTPPAPDYDKELARLQAELVKLQLWVKETGARAIVIFEGRDAAGKGGVIKRITEWTSPRIFQVVALARAKRTRKNPDLLPALHRALPRRRGDRALRPQLV